jgi:hypothetical protein
LACAIAITIARVAARWRSETPRWSIMVERGHRRGEADQVDLQGGEDAQPVSPNGRSSGARRATTQSSTPRASSRRISDSMTTMIGSSTKSESSTAERPALRMTSIRISMRLRQGSKASSSSGSKA